MSLPVVSITNKLRYIELSKTMTIREVYEIYKQEEPKVTINSFSAFKSMLIRWKKKLASADPETLYKGTYPGFIAHDATVQINANGEIKQAWIKQAADSFDSEAFLDALKGTVDKYKYGSKNQNDGKDLLEIPLFDMHWGVAYFDHYEKILDDILEIIYSRKWDKIVIPFGQDFFHNDSVINGVTTKGTLIEKVDMYKAVNDGRKFIYAIIDAAIEQSGSVKVMYSPGNHDRSISWMFMQVLLERYGSEVVDDSLEYRKCFVYGKNAVMITHGDSKRASSIRNMAQLFPVSFPMEYATTTTREIHSGHLHTEQEMDSCGIMVRRLSTASKLDDWSDKEDLIGSHRRFMLFHWTQDQLKAIYYISGKEVVK